MQMRTLIGTGLLLATFMPLSGQDSALQQSLIKEFTLSEVSPDKIAITNPGTMLVLQKSNLLMYSTECPVAPINEFKAKSARISQPFGKSFVRDMGGSLRMSGNATTADCPQQRFTRGMGVYVAQIDVQKGAIVFHLYCRMGMLYYGDLKFPFEKGSIASLDEANAMIKQVFVMQAPLTARGNAPPGQEEEPAQNAVCNVYLAQQTGARLFVSPDGSFLLQASTGQASSGRYAVVGNSLVLTHQLDGRADTYVINGDTLYGAGTQWTRQPDAPMPSAASSQSAAPAAPEPPQSALQMPATYVNTQVSGDKLRLNADHTFALQAAGQKYSGAFRFDGRSLELDIAPDVKSVATVEGNQLRDANGQIWTLQPEAPPAAGPPARAPTGASAGVLRNQDIIALVSAGVPDAEIIAKISASKCQFDTSADAILQLSRAGASAAVLRAVRTARK
jgi:hypothetical protein